MIINLEEIYGKKQGKNALISEIPNYINKILELLGTNTTDAILTGAAPVWLYLVLAHALHGKVALLQYESPVTGCITIHDHRS